MNRKINYIKDWQKSLQLEIMHLKTKGSTKYLVKNGRLAANDEVFTYYFESNFPVRIPAGSAIRVEWGSANIAGRILSSEGDGVILSINQTLGDKVSQAFILHDPWELLEQLIMRLDEIKKSKQKRIRVKRLMYPTMEPKHPTIAFKSAAHELRVRSKYNPITYVWGPPGTGKTYTLARAAANHYFLHKKVLILSHSNQAVDVLMAELAGFLKRKKRFIEGDILRYGFTGGEGLVHHEDITITQLIEHQHPSLSKNKKILEYERQLLKKDLSLSFSRRDTEELLEVEGKLTSVMEKVRQKELKFVKNALVVGATLAKAASDPAIYESQFDIVILDEASMAYVPQAAFAASLGKHTIICGDFKQLSPIASSNHPLVNQWLREDIFHSAGIINSVANGHLHPHLFLLNEQRRMHPDISSFTNQYIYHSLVSDHESVRESRKDLAKKKPFANRASVLLDTQLSGDFCTTQRSTKSKMNIWQLLLSFQVIHEAYIGGFRSIGFVTPYRAQAMLMETLLRELYGKELLNADIISATVHRFQGSERDIMVFDSVDGYPMERPGMLLAGRDSERLVNVAITRTKGKFVHVANAEYIRCKIKADKTLRQLTDYQIANDQALEIHEIGKWIQHQHPNLQWMHAKKLERMFKDMENAKTSILVSIPAGAILSDEWHIFLNKKSHLADITFITPSRPLGVPHSSWMEASLPFSFVVIDSKIMWLGVYFEGIIRLEPPFVTLRLEAPAFMEGFLKELPI
ncbi:DEAD/DEAH box helicase [Heyndrickxia acidicola]|uniref:AAA domain-containing protein n=1 Tax=Heyndrickxia acidicola TaxID=209389 RepID=A0ABU6MAI4_9BACI|nr:AAA domain-containing protein [Heyndrickxia acidicola]MED1201631.1 AAA domain-containing protein [Heyndrickxia acidicola]